MEFSRIFDLTLPSNVERMHTISATKEECQAIAERLGALDLKALEARFKIIQEEDPSCFIISGKLHAELTQNCVVTLLPVDEVVDEAMSIKVRLEEHPEEHEEFTLEPGEGEDIEYAPHAKVNVGELVVQYLALAMNPYPKKEGVVALHGDEVSLSQKPFAKLAEIKKS